MAPPNLNAKMHIEKVQKRVRVLFGGAYIVDTQAAKFVWEKPYYPTYFFPHNALDEKYLRESLNAAQSTSKKVYDVVVGDRVAEAAVTKYLHGSTTPELEGLLKVTFGAMDAWFEEDEQVFVHPKDPYKRVDVLPSSRHVRVEVNGVEVANTHSPLFLFETSLIVRTYIKKTDCRMDLLKPSDLTTQCPYKGTANYYHVQTPGNDTAENIVWWYQVPLPEVSLIKGYVSFYDEKVDVWVDGVKRERPTSPFVDLTV
ncbi:hypothetical protein ONZ45_g10782 [Pleurotus djamor]|nr:hypothetical protein ONZ45_g10782 [Pleurotus djamor]